MANRTKNKEPAVPPVMTVEMWSLDRIKPYPNNPKTHPPEQVALLARMMLKYGVDQNIVVRVEDGFILKGHGRRLAAIAGGMTHFPVFAKSVPNDDDARAQRIADNQVALLAGWDRALLSAEASALKLAGYDLPLLGFPQVTLDWMTGGDLVTNPDGEWNGMPHFENPEAKGFRHIVVHFHDQAGVDAFAEAVGLKINDKTKWLWYPDVNIVPFTKWEGNGPQVSDLHRVERSVADPAHGEGTQQNGGALQDDRRSAGV